MSRLSLERIALARSLIDPRFLDSPLRRCAALNARLGCDVLLKDETVNPIGCFKGRGAGHLLSQRSASTPLVCASAGNFGLAMAHACARRGVPLTVFVATGANPAKREGIRRLGARIVEAGTDFDAAKLAARRHASEHALCFIEDGAEAAISEGAGTIAIELLASSGTCDAVLVPLGNGALLAGMARWIKAVAPSVEVIGVASAGAPVMVECWRRGGLSTDMDAARADTLADGIAVRVPVPDAVTDLQLLVDDMLLVADEALLAAMRLLHTTTGRVAEPSAVAGLAAIAADRARFAGRCVATVLTGRNLARDQITAWFG
jgi:threonine dehydratase